MKTIKKESTYVLTPSALFAFLTQVEELDGQNIGISEDEGVLTIYIGNSEYKLRGSEDSEVKVDAEVVDEIKDINEDCYEEVDNEEVDEPVEGGIIKELAKTLLIGGLVRLTKNAIMKS